MGKRGPASTPSHMKLVRGETRPSRVNYDEPVAPQGADLDPPDYLDADARGVWERLAPTLQSRGVLTAWDVDAFGAFCTAVVHHRRAAKLVNDTQVLIVNGDTVRKHPGMQVIRDQASLIVSLGGRFGLNPSDRSQIIAGALRDSSVDAAAQQDAVWGVID